MHSFLKFIFGKKLYMLSYKFGDRFLASCQQTRMTYTIALCTVKNS
jgi:hypothetical protein